MIWLSEELGLINRRLVDYLHMGHMWCDLDIYI
jgi:hypothetical protein